MNKADTESSVNIDVSAFAIIVETLSISTFPNCEELPFWRSVSVTTILSIGASLSISTDPSENIPCVAATFTDSAPRSFRILDAAAIVPPVSIISSRYRRDYCCCIKDLKRTRSKICQCCGYTWYIFRWFSWETSRCTNRQDNSNWHTPSKW